MSLLKYLFLIISTLFFQFGIEAQIVADGTLDLAYGMPKCIQDTPTGFGDNSDPSPLWSIGSELDGAYGLIDGTTLCLMFTGNLETNFNKLEIFLDVGPGGQNKLRGDNPNVDFDGLNRMGDDGSGNGLVFDNGFEADYYFTITNGNPGAGYELYANMAETPDLGGGVGMFLGGSGIGNTTLVSGNGISIGINNSNIGGVDGMSVNSPGSVMTGIEICIPLSVIGNPTLDVKVSAFVNGGSHDFVSNQVLCGLGGSVNLGEPRNVSFSSIPGEQFFIVDNIPPTMSIQSITSVAEGDLGMTNASFAVTLDAPTSKTVTVDYATADGTAITGDNDYVGQSGTLTINAGFTSVDLIIQVNGDELDESDENFTVTLSNPVNATLDNDLSTATITDDDSTPVITMGQSFSIDENTPDMTTIGFILATDADAGTTFQSWMIIGGNMDGVFDINPMTGALSVVDNSNLDRETTASYTLSITVSDGTNTSQPADVVININDVNDVPPVVTPGQEFTIMMSGASNGSPVGTVVATDADVTPTVFQDWMIISGNNSSDGDGDLPFAIDPMTGEITINDIDDLSGYSPIYTLEVTVSDGVNTSASEIITIILVGFPIPTISQWGLIILSLSLFIIGLNFLRREEGDFSTT